MIDTNEEPTGYQDDVMESTGAASSATSFETHTTTTKKSSKAPLFIFSGVFLLFALGAGYMMFGGSDNPNNQNTPAVADVADNNEDITADDLGSEDLATQTNEPTDPLATDPLADPLATDPLATNPATANMQIDPVTGLPVSVETAQTQQATIDPATGLPIAQPVAQPANTQQTTIDPATGLPVTSATVNVATQTTIDPATGLPVTVAVAPAQQAQQIDPLAALASQQETPIVQTQTQPVQPVQQQTQQPVVNTPVSTPEVQTTVSSTPVATTVETTIEPAVTNDPLQSFRDLLSPIDSRVTTLEGTVSKLGKRMSAVEQKIKDGFTPKSAAPKSAPKSNKVVVDYNQNMRVEPPVSRIVIEHKPAIDNRVDVVETYQDCKIQAIVQGRVWVKRTDGSFVSYGEGDSWTNGATIQSIDPDKGIRIGNNWICM